MVPHEVESALAEGIQIKDRSQVVAFIGDNGRMQCVRLQPTRPGPCDENDIAWPEIIPDSQEFELSFDQAFVAIGQTGAYRGIQTGKGVDITERGLIRIDDKGLTGIDGVYATGDAVSGATSVVHAMAHGRSVAAGIMKDLAIQKWDGWVVIYQRRPPLSRIIAHSLSLSPRPQSWLPIEPQRPH